MSDRNNAPRLNRRLVLAAGASAPLVSSLAFAKAKTLPRDREIVWRRIMDDLSFEHAFVTSSERGPIFGGAVLIAQAGAPLRADYVVECDADWRTLGAEIIQTYRGEERKLSLWRDGAGNWFRNGERAEDLAGCTDIDLGVTPATNAIPVNRLRLQAGESKTIRAAWVRFPSLDIVAAEQSYARESARRYLYRSLASGFEAAIEVDEDGFPVEYSGVWRRVAEGKLAARHPLAARMANFAAALAAPGPAREIAPFADDFGWLVGGWEAEIIDYPREGGERRGRGEWWFAWVLEGRAMQDVWISPPRADRAAPRDPNGAADRYGATLRHFDRRAGLWRIHWTNPVSGAVNALSGRREGDEIVLTGVDDGAEIRWRFHEIADASFRWSGERRQRDGGWRREAEFRLRRISR